MWWFQAFNDTIIYETNVCERRKEGSWFISTFFRHLDKTVMFEYLSRSNSISFATKLNSPISDAPSTKLMVVIPASSLTRYQWYPIRGWWKALRAIAVVQWRFPSVQYLVIVWFLHFLVASPNACIIKCFSPDFSLATRMSLWILANVTWFKEK